MLENLALRQHLAVLTRQRAAVGTQALGGAAADYLDRVRAEMGLPLATDAEPE